MGTPKSKGVQLHKETLIVTTTTISSLIGA